MSELNAATKTRTGKSRPSPRIDLTAMVDLGFLLITFFMLVTMFTQMKTMVINMPEDKTDNFPIKADKLLTLLIGKDQQYFTYAGEEIDSAVKTDFSAAGFRAALLDRKDFIAKKFPEKPFLFVRIKAMPESKYNDLIQALDEISICRIGTYAIIKPTTRDSIFLADHFEQNY